MNIERLAITNFKNISFVEYVLGSINCIEAKNHTGKTNTASAVYWLLTGKQLDGRTDDIGLKPIGKSNERVSVKIEFTNQNGKHTIEKSYQEKWSKTRGSGELTLTGHETKYSIDEIEQSSIQDARNEIDSVTGVDCSKFGKLKGFNPYEAIMNPLYIGNICEWKTTRQLIIDYIIGDISNEEVMEAEPKAAQAKELLTTYDYKVDKVINYCNQQMDGISKKITELEAQRDLLIKTEDIPEEELKRIESEIDEKKKVLEALATATTSNPLIAEKVKAAEKLKAEKARIYSEEHEAYMRRVEAESKDVELKRLEMNAKNSVLNEKINAAQKANKDTFENYKEIETKQNKLELAQSKRDKLLKEYYSLKEEKMPETKAAVCPHCGGVLNEEEIKASQDNWKLQYEKKIEDNKAAGIQTKLEIEDLKKTIEQLKVKSAELEKAEADANSEKENAAEQYRIASEKYSDALNNAPKMADFKPSQKWYDISAEETSLLMEIESLKAQPMPGELERKQQAEALEKEIESLKAQQGKHYIYLNNMKQAEDLKASIKMHQKNHMVLEGSKAAAILFNKTKLNILEAKLTAHFGNEVKWVLVENNLKEGSWNDVCYPLITGTNTPFILGSTSERVMTGIKIIEVLKKELNLPDLPIIIDEIGELDSESIINLKTITKSQIIATRVNDNMSKPTIVQL